MHELIPTHTLEELCAHRERALERYRATFKAYLAAHEAGIRAVNGTQFHGPPEIARAFGYQPRAADEDEFVGACRSSLDEQIWRYVINATRLGDVMDSTAREELENGLRTAVPHATLDNMRATLSTLHGDAAKIMCRGVITLFERLSPEYRRHDAFRFTGRFVLKGALRAYAYGGGWSGFRGADGLLRDLERVLAVFDGQAPPEYIASVSNKLLTATRGWQIGIMETDKLRIRWFKNGNLHVDVLNPEHIERINAILADRGGIPDGRREA